MVLRSEARGSATLQPRGPNAPTTGPLRIRAAPALCAAWPAALHGPLCWRPMSRPGARLGLRSTSRLPDAPKSQVEASGGRNSPRFRHRRAPPAWRGGHHAPRGLEGGDWRLAHWNKVQRVAVPGHRRRGRRGRELRSSAATARGPVKLWLTSQEGAAVPRNAGSGSCCPRSAACGPPPARPARASATPPQKAVGGAGAEP